MSLAADELRDDGEVWKVDPVTHARLAWSLTTDATDARIERGHLRDPDGRVVVVVGA